MSETNRRTFITKTGLTIAAATSSTALGTRFARAGEVNKRIRIGVIGCGGQGNAHIGNWRQLVNEGAELAYVCDPDDKRLTMAAKSAEGAQPVSDLRQILDDPTVDAVSIATPDHWHTPAALLAMDAGKHVYVEKPCSHNFREGQLLVETSARTGKVVQHGTQMRSSDGFTHAIQMLRDGVIGDVLIAKGWNIQRRNDIGRSEPSEPPAGFDYDLWVGPAPMVPYRANCHHYSWHWWYNFGTGDAGNDGVHEFDYARWGLGVDTHPTSVAVVGGKYYFDDDQQFPDTVTATFEYPGDGSAGSRRQLIFEMRIWSNSRTFNVDGGTEFYGTRGKMFISRRGKFQMWDDRNRSVDTKPEKTPSMDVRENMRAFLAAVRGQAEPTADARTAHLSTTLVHLANNAVRLGRSFQFDPEAEQVVGDDEANRLLARSYRDGHWAVPKGV